MEVSKTLSDAIVSTLEVFAATADAIAATAREAASQRAQQVNFTIDVARIEGLDNAEIAKVIGVEIFGACVDTDILSLSTANAYRSGLKRALHWGASWHPRAHLAPEDGGLAPIPQDERTGRGNSGRKAKVTRAVTKGTIKVDKKTRTLTVQLAKSAPLDDFTQAIKVIQSEPGRIAMLLAWVKAHDWK
jgi:hypothetical protein